MFPQNMFCKRIERNLSETGSLCPKAKNHRKQQQQSGWIKILIVIDNSNISFSSAIENWKGMTKQYEVYS